MKRLASHFKHLKVSPKATPKQVDQAFVTRLQELQSKNDEEGVNKLKEAYFAVSDYSKTRSQEAELEQEILKGEQKTESSASQASNSEETHKESERGQSRCNGRQLARRRDDAWFDSFFKDIDSFERGVFENFFPRRFFGPRRSLRFDNFDNDPFFRSINRKMRDLEDVFERTFESLKNNEKAEQDDLTVNENSGETNSNKANQEANARQQLITKNQKIIRGLDGKTFEAVSESSSEIDGKRVTKIKTLTRDDKGVNTVQERIEDENGVRTKNYKVTDEEFRRLLRSRGDLDVLALE